MTLPQDVIGVDIAKGWIDTFTLSTLRHERIPAAKEALARFARSAKGALVVCEASRGYERPLTEALAKAAEDCTRVNPRQAREFARATGGWPRPIGSMPKSSAEWAGQYPLNRLRPSIPSGRS